MWLYFYILGCIIIASIIVLIASFKDYYRVNYKELVNEFQQVVARKVNDYTCVDRQFSTDDKVANIKCKLIKEECDELIEALQEKDEGEVLKELCDVLYIAFGIAATYNFPIEEAFKEVHKNNMLKVNNTIRVVDGKFTKPKNHPKCDFSSLLIRDNKQQEFKFFE